MARVAFRSGDEGEGGETDGGGVVGGRKRGNEREERNSKTGLFVRLCSARLRRKAERKEKLENVLDPERQATVSHVFVRAMLGTLFGPLPPLLRQDRDHD